MSITITGLTSFIEAAFVLFRCLSNNLAAALEERCGSVGLAIGSYSDVSWIDPPPTGEGVSILTMTLCRSNTGLTGSLIQNYIVPISETGQNPEFCDHYDDNLIVCISNADPGAAALIDVSQWHSLDGSNDEEVELPGVVQPVHVAVLSNGVVASANYAGSSVATFDPSNTENAVIQVVEKPVELATGDAGNAGRQEAPHPHQILETEDGHILVPDLGTDSVYRYSVSVQGALTDAGLTKVSAGTGPRHAALGVNGKAYVVGELTLTLIEIGPQCIEGAEGGAAGVCKVVELPKVNDEGIAFDSAAAVRVSEDKKYVYVSLRMAEDSTEPGAIVAHALGGDGNLGQFIGKWSTGGPKPRDFNLVKVPGVEGEVFVIGNRKDDAVEVFEKDTKTGFMGDKIASLFVDSPTCILPLKVMPPEPANEPVAQNTSFEEED